MEFFISDNFCCWVYNDFLLWCYRFFKDAKVIESCLDKKFSSIMTSFKTCWSYLLGLLMALGRSRLRIDEVSLSETFGSLKIRNFRYTPYCLQLLRKSMHNFSLFFLYSSFSYLRKSLTITFPCFRAESLLIFIIFLESTKF